MSETTVPASSWVLVQAGADAPAWMPYLSQGLIPTPFPAGMFEAEREVPISHAEAMILMDGIARTGLVPVAIRQAYADLGLHYSYPAPARQEL